MLHDEDALSLDPSSDRSSLLVRGSRQSDIMTVSILVLVFIAVVVFLELFQSLLVPFTFAVFFAQLFEPVLAVLVRGPHVCFKSLRLFNCGRHAPSALPRTNRRDVAAQLSEETQEAVLGLSTLNGKPQHACQRLLVWLQRTWDIVSVIFCTGLLLGAISSVIWGIVAALEGFNWSKYSHSKRMKDLIHLLESMGISFKNFNGSYVMNNFRSQIMDALTSLLNLSEGMVLTLLMFFFCLLAFVTRIHDQRGARPPQMKRLVQQYLLWKTLVSLIIGAVVGISLKLLKVDLAELFGLVTFILNFIPNLGSFFATIAPVPLAALDPDKDFQQVALVLIVPFLIHNTLGCIIEPKVMADGLDLHPLTIIVALTFWGSVWGIAGAILSIPITSVIRLWLSEVNHPYAKVVYHLFNPDAQPNSTALAPDGRPDNQKASDEPGEPLLLQGATAGEHERGSGSIGAGAC